MATPPVFSAGAVLTAGQMNAVGLWRVASGTLSGTTEDFQGVFTDDFTNYLINIDQISMSGAGDLYWQMMSGSSVISSANYSWALNGFSATSTGQDSGSGGQTGGYTGVTLGAGIANFKVGYCTLTMMAPKVAERTVVLSQSLSYTTFFRALTGASVLDTTTSYDGVRFATLTAVTFTGNVVIYGYNKP